MKTIIQFITIALLIFVTSCSDGDKTTLDMEKVVPPAFDAELSKSTMDPTPIHQKDIVFTINWHKSQFPANVPVKNTLQFAVKGTNFAKVASFELPTDKSTFTITDYDLNSALYLDAKVRFDEVVDIEVRILSEVKTDNAISTITPVASKSQDFKITIYEAPTILSPLIAIGGEFQAVDGGEAWNFDLETGTTLPSPKRDNVYTGYVYFNVGSSPFKIFDRKDVLGASKFTMSGLVKAGTDDAMTMQGATSAPAVYYMTVDVKNKTINAELKTDWIGDPANMTWCVIGSAFGGWGYANQTPLAFNKSRGVWESEISFGTGEFKFKKLATTVEDEYPSWVYNYGKGDLADKLSTAASPGGANVAVAEGKFEAVLDIRNPNDARFSMIKK